MRRTKEDKMSDLSFEITTHRPWVVDVMMMMFRMSELTANNTESSSNFFLFQFLVIRQVHIRHDVTI